MLTKLERAELFASQAAFYIPKDSECIRINVYDPDTKCILGTGEETGKEYCVELYDIDPDSDKFFKLVEMS